MILNYFAKLIKFKELVFSLLYLEINTRHAGQKLGAFWALTTPLILMFVYAFLFFYIFPAKFQQNGIEFNYTLNIFSGLISWLVTQDVIMKSTGILKSNRNLIKQISFPLETIPIKTVLVSYFTFSLAFIFVFTYSLYDKFSLDKFYFSILLLFVQFIFLIGISCIISIFSLILKDIQELIYFFNTLNLFALPILYNPNTTPTWLKKIFMLNPFSYLVICWQDILFKNFVPDLFIWAIGFFFSLLIFFIGLLIYKKSKSFLGDYI
jgi:lipopolysaccharide transport system permease protein